MINFYSLIFSESACGNGLIEDGEGCDCGTLENCERANNTCCSNCQFIARGTVCREAVNSCDVPEFCDGTSQVCPADLVTVNGISCDVEQGYCYRGECRTHDNQCDQLWIGGAFKADESCYEDGNRNGDETGYCKKLSENKYMACKNKDVQCGKLMCIGSSTITPKDLGYGLSSTILFLNNGHEC
ncbi:Hypothetical predicted protein, partial [Paramuricea clavata]